MAQSSSVLMHNCVCVPPQYVAVGSLFDPCAEYWTWKRCVCLCGLEWQKGWQWGLHPKKGFLSRWQLQDWQDAILLGNGVSQPVSLPVRQPLTPLNLAFCWAVTGLALTLHVASLINCTMKHTQGGKPPRWTLCTIILRLEVPLMALMTKTALSRRPFTALSRCHLTNTPHAALDSVMSTASPGWLSTHWDTRAGFGHCAAMEMMISVCVHACVCRSKREKFAAFPPLTHCKSFPIVAVTG